MRRTCFLPLALGALAALPSPAQPPQPLKVKVVVVTMFERGADTGDRPGELQFWVERENLARVYPFPQGYRDLRASPDDVLGIVTGVGTARAAASIMALGCDPRFDLTKAYWLIAGIAGGDPADVSLGSAVWAEYVVDGDLAHEIDPREIPPDWATGYVPLRKSRPYEPPRKDDEGEVYRLDPALVDWAYELTRAVPLGDSDAMREHRQAWAGAYPNAARPPFVAKGDNLAAMTFWHGDLLNRWANDWVKYYTEGRGNYMTSAMEDSGTLQALTFLSRAGKVDRNRVLVLRTVSNFDSQPPGSTAAESLASTRVGSYAAYVPALEAAHAVGRVVVREIVKSWARFEHELPRR